MPGKMEANTVESTDTATMRFIEPLLGSARSSKLARRVAILICGTARGGES